MRDEEVASIAFDPSPTHASVWRRTAPSRFEAVHLVGLAALVLISFVSRDWALQAMSTSLLLAIPISLTWRVLRLDIDLIRAFPVVKIGLGLLSVSLTALVTDAFGTLIGVRRPLSRSTLILGLSIAIVAMMITMRRTAPCAKFSMRWPTYSQVTAFLLPIPTVIGALLLNRGDTAAAAVLGVVGALIAAGALLISRRPSASTFSYWLFAIAFALTLSYAMRSNYTFGYDISGEHAALANVTNSGVWHAGHPHDAYGAVLSITILPAAFHFVSGVSDVVLLKVGPPFILALTAVAVYHLLRRMSAERVARAIAVLLVIQQYFVHQLPAVARQSVGLLFFVGLLSTLFAAPKHATSKSLKRSSRIRAVIAMCLGLALTHYSSAYVAIAVVLGGVAVAFVLGAGQRQSSSPDRRFEQRLWLTAALSLTAFAGLWYGAVTQSASNLTNFASTLKSHGFDLLPSSSAHGSGLNSYLQGNAGTALNAAGYAADAEALYANSFRYVHTWPDSNAPQFRLADASIPLPAARLEAVDTLFNDASLGTQQLFNLALAASAVGLTVFVVVRRRSDITAVYGAAVALVSVAGLGLARLSGSIAASYNQERLQAQLGITLAMAVGLLVSQLRPSRLWKRVAIGVTSVAILAAAVSNTGLAAFIFGQQDSSNLSSRGEDYERFYISSQEVAAARWFVVRRPKGALWYTDRYGQLPILGYSGNASSDGLLQDITPGTLDRGAWIFASPVNLLDGRARGQIGDQTTIYRFPLKFIDQHYNTVYDNGSVRIYHGD